MVACFVALCEAQLWLREPLVDGDGDLDALLLHPALGDEPFADESVDLLPLLVARRHHERPPLRVLRRFPGDRPVTLQRVLDLDHAAGLVQPRHRLARPSFRCVPHGLPQDPVALPADLIEARDVEPRVGQVAEGPARLHRRVLAAVAARRPPPPAASRACPPRRPPTARGDRPRARPFPSGGRPR